jgi:hypothetical protein
LCLNLHKFVVIYFERNSKEMGAIHLAASDSKKVTSLMKVILGIMYVLHMRCKVCAGNNTCAYGWPASCSITVNKEGVNSADNSTQMMQIY